MAEITLADALNADLVRRAWREVSTRDGADAEHHSREFRARQPALAAYLQSLLADAPNAVASLGFDLTLALDLTYHLASGSPAAAIDEGTVLAAADASEERFLSATHAQPEAFMRSLLDSHQLAAPQVPRQLVASLLAANASGSEIEADETDLLLFLIYSTARIFECGEGLASSPIARSRGSAPSHTGQTAPKVGRNEPCPCGSGRKFKHCCLKHLHAAPSEPTPPEQVRFAEYFACVEEVMRFAQDYRGPDGAWHAKQLEALEETYPVGDDGLLPDSVHLNYVLFDLELPRARTTIGALFGRKLGHRLDAKAQRQLRELCSSYLAFYELTGSDNGKQTFRELITGDRWIGCDVEAPADFDFEIGEIWLCRFVGSRDDAIAFGQPLVYAPEALPEIEEALSVMREEIRAAKLDSSETSFATEMKSAGELLVAYITTTAPDEDDEEQVPDDEDDAELENLDD